MGDGTVRADFHFMVAKEISTVEKSLSIHRRGYASRFLSADIVEDCFRITRRIDPNDNDQLSGGSIPYESYGLYGREDWVQDLLLLSDPGCDIAEFMIEKIKHTFQYTLADYLKRHHK